MTAKRTATKKSRQQSARAKEAGVKPSMPPDETAETTAEKVARVIGRIECGELLTAACLAEVMSVHRLMEWRDTNENNRQRYARARDAQAHRIAEDVLAIADDSGGDVRYGPKNEIMPDAEFTARSRLRMDARKWYVAKVAPRQYGDKLDVTSDGKPLNPAAIAQMTAAELRAEIAKRMTSA